MRSGWHPGAILDAKTALQLQRLAGNRATSRLITDTEASGDDAGEHSSPVRDVVGRGGGTPVEAGLRSRMEAHLGHDLTSVRVHSDARSAESVGARAYTVGNDIVVHPSYFSPGTASAEQTLAHELTHVAQQRSGPVSGVPAAGGIRVSDPSDSFEQEAEASAKAVLTPTAAGAKASASANLQDGSPAGTSRAARDVVQRLLMTSNQLEAVGGTAKSNVLWVKMSARYKSVFEALDRYHSYLNETVVTSSNVLKQRQWLHLLLDLISKAANTYLTQHKADHGDARYRAIANLVNEVTDEKRSVNSVQEQMSRDTTGLSGKKWREIIRDASFGELGGLGATPMGAEAIDREPAAESTFAKDTRLYTAPDLAVPLTVSGQVQVGRKNDPCMSARLLSTTKVLYAELYSLNGKDVKVTASGYVKAGTVKAGKVRHEDVAGEVPLFTHIPNIEDIKQGAIGDCYLMAAMGAVVKQNPASIYEMMRDNGETVTVRLYKVLPTSRGGGIHPVYITVRKSLIDDGRRSRGAMWCAILEKAYAVLAQGPGGTAKSASYQALGAGDDPGTALDILTGRASTKLDTQTGSGAIGRSSSMWNEAFILNYTRKYRPRWKEQKLSNQDVDSWHNSEPYNLFGDEGEAFMDWLVDARNMFLPRFRAAAKEKVIEAFEPILSDMEQANDPPNKAWRDKLDGALRKRYAGVRGTARYTKQQIKAYDAIENALVRGMHVASGTQGLENETGVDVEETKGHSGNESKGLGIVGSHAYTVLKVRTDPATKLRYVTVRNPWGHYGRLYKGFSDAGKLQVETDVSKLESQSGTFELELNDFTNNFRSTSVS